MAFHCFHCFSPRLPYHKTPLPAHEMQLEEVLDLLILFTVSHSPPVTFVSHSHTILPELVILLGYLSSSLPPAVPQGIRAKCVEILVGFLRSSESDERFRVFQALFPKSLDLKKFSEKIVEAIAQGIAEALTGLDDKDLVGKAFVWLLEEFQKNNGSIE